MARNPKRTYLLDEVVSPLIKTNWGQEALRVTCVLGRDKSEHIWLYNNIDGTNYGIEALQME